MSDIYSLLNIKKNIIRDFPILANRVADHQTEKVINKNMSKLKEIEGRLLVDKGIEVTQQSIDEVIRKVKRFSAKEDDAIENWSIRELRIVSYYLMKLRNKAEDYHFALTLLDKGWKNMFFNGLVFYLMNSWNSIEAEYRDATSQLVIKKLHEYKDNNKKYQLLRNNANLFDKNGPIRMAALLSAKSISLIDAPTIIGFKTSAIKQSYYSDVIIKYIESNKIRNLDRIEEIFENHNLDRTKKLVFANLVEQADRSGDDVKRNILCKFINRLLGDVTLESTWAPFAGASYDEAQKLKRAMKLVYMWFAQQIIEVFFDVCVQDRERRDFWLKYVGHLSGFKIVGSTATKRVLQNDGRVSSMFLRHFIETKQYSSMTSALVLFIKNKMIVEFSDTGALYVYNQNHEKVKLIITQRKFHLDSTNDLKIPSMQSLIEADYWGGYDFNEQGRMTHQGYWQSRLSQWMQRIVLSNNNAVSFLDTKDDELFKETPLSKEEINKPELPKKTTEDKPQQTSLFNSNSWKQETKPIQKDGEVIYERNVTVRLSSKWLEGNIRVVANDWGFYIGNATSTQYARIRRYIPGEKAIGAIWIKRSNGTGWNEVVHFYNGAEISVGYITRRGREVLYKEDIHQENFKVIKFN